MLFRSKVMKGAASVTVAVVVIVVVTAIAIAKNVVTIRKVRKITIFTKVKLLRLPCQRQRTETLMVLQKVGTTMMRTAHFLLQHIVFIVMIWVCWKMWRKNLALGCKMINEHLRVRC